MADRQGAWAAGCIEPAHPRARATRCAAAYENSDSTTGRTSSITSDSDAAQTCNVLPNTVRPEDPPRSLPTFLHENRDP